MDYCHGGTLFGFARNSWKMSETWRELPRHCSRLAGQVYDFTSVLGFEDPRELVGVLLGISTFVCEKRLILACLSTDVEQNYVVPLERGKKRRLDFSLKQVKAGLSLVAPETIIEVVDDGLNELGDGPSVTPEVEDPQSFLRKNRLYGRERRRRR
ncbi:hypothetical protein KSP39_PZI011374 [Platanthera zijinensis]|uniref:Uncharacterized protein n=1 Tax=Platanthera zijinensis TaxID=2320716 RepID=A0AAP0BJR3_9ASPA